jgi:hypothetical protein
MRRLIVIASSLVLLLSPAAAEAATHKHPPRRKGGTVHRAWPARGHGWRPRSNLARFLARQVGPTKITKAMRRAAARHRQAHAAATGASTTTTAVPSPVADISGSQKLYLVRSYEIPSNDPAAARLANLSWTYDNAVAAIALDADGDTAEAQQLLDQLAALQRTDGSLDFAYDTSNGNSIQQFRTGTIAWVGYAAALHRAVTNSKRYDALEAGAAKWLLARQLPSGLLAGGSDVTWASTQHNEIAYLFLAAVAADPVGGLSATTLTTAANKIVLGIDSQLTITPAGGQLGFVEGTNDALRPIDAQTLGILYLLARARYADALKVHNYIESAFKLTGRTIAKSSASATFNMTYSSSATFSGYKPYATGGPDVLWDEGGAQEDLATKLLALDHSAQDTALLAWMGVTTPVKLGPLQADRTVTDSAVNEYHVWPASAATSWSLLAIRGFPTS